MILLYLTLLLNPTQLRFTQAEVMADFVQHRLRDDTGHVVDGTAVLLDGLAEDSDLIGQDITVPCAACGQSNALVEPKQGHRRLDVCVVHLLAAGPVFDDNGHIPNSAAQVIRQAIQGFLHHTLIKGTSHDPDYIRFWVVGI